MPIEWCVAIEKATKGAITRRDLRADWRHIWPELAKSKKAAQLAQQPAAKKAFTSPDDDFDPMVPIDNTSKG